MFGNLTCLPVPPLLIGGPTSTSLWNLLGSSEMSSSTMTHQQENSYWVLILH
jgi:hypothetical protein